MVPRRLKKAVENDSVTLVVGQIECPYSPRLLISFFSLLKFTLGKPHVGFYLVNSNLVLCFNSSYLHML